jgi:Kef-type K+ transport system membrane component KefB
MNETTQLFFALALLLGLAKTLGYLAFRLGQPSVLGELLTGVILGPSVLDMWGEWVLLSDGENLKEALFLFAELGILMLIFSAGLKIDLPSLRRVGRAAFLVGLISVILPLMFITPLAMQFSYSFEKALFISIVLASMSTAIGAQVMLELGVLQSREGLTLLGAALVDDLLVVLLVSLFLAVNPGGIVTAGQTRPLLEVLLRMGLFLLLGSFLAWVLLPPLFNRVAKTPIPEAGLLMALVAALVWGVLADYIGGIAMIAGAFIAGVAIGQAKRGLIERLDRSLQAFNYGFFVPLFFVSIGLKADLGLLESQILLFSLVLLLFAIVSKMLGAWLGSRLAGINNLSSLRISLGMISRGEVGLILATIGINNSILEAEVFSILVFIVLSTTFITPPLVRLSFSPWVAAWFSVPIRPNDAGEPSP